MRVLHGVTGAANQPATVSGLQRSLGADARCLTVSQGGFGFKADIVIDQGSDPQESYSTFLAEHADDYDVFHFYFRSFFFFDPRNNAFPSGLDLLLLRAMGKTVIVHYRGSEVREANRFQDFSPYNYVDENPSGIFSKFSEPSLSQRVDFVRSVANAVLVPDEELQSYVPGSRIVRRAIDLTDLTPAQGEPNAIPLVCHAPSRRVVKGTDYVIDAVQQLREEGLQFDFQLVEDLPHEEAKALYRRADIIIDQLRIGWFGVLALEGMALGKCVLAYVRDDLTHVLGDEPPLLITAPPTLVDDLRTAIQSSDLRSQIGARGREYVEEHHDASKIARELLDLYAEPEVRNRPVDAAGVLDYLLVQRQDTKAIYRKKFASTAGSPTPFGDLVAQFRRTRRRRGLVAASKVTLRWIAHRAAPFIPGGNRR